MNLSAKSPICHWGSLIVTILVIVGLGAFIGYSSGSGAQSEWYQGLQKSSLNPPGFVFGIVWPILYTLMAVAAWWTWRQEPSEAVDRAKGWFVAQLGLNYAWSYIFFSWEQSALAFMWIILTLIFVLIWVRALSKLNDVMALIQIPYIAWLCFASYLSASIVFLN